LGDHADESGEPVESYCVHWRERSCVSGSQSHQDDCGDFGRPAANPGILELRPEAKVKLYTTPDLIVESRAWVNFAALRIEDKGDGADVSLCVVGLDKPVAFRAAVLNAHGTIQAGINLLHRAFTLETPLWKFKAKRNEKEDRFELFVIAHWQEWNEKGVLWNRRFFDAQDDRQLSPRNMGLDGFKKRCTREMGLIYWRKGKSRK
jgi:hypothetical protein